MSDEFLTLASDFPQVSHQEWLAEVDRVLKGASFDEVLRSTTPDGITVEPLYTRDDEGSILQVPAVGTSRRATNVAGSTAGWDVRQRHGLTSPGATNEAILSDLQRGVTSIELVTAGIDDVNTLDAVLADVLLDLAPISLWSPGHGLDHARLYLQLVAQRGLTTGEITADLGCDPIGRLAAQGSVGVAGVDAVAEVAELASSITGSHPLIRTFRADSDPYVMAGASPATELGVIAGTAIAYVRAMVDAGVGPEAAFGNVLLGISVGTEQFSDIAKLRALRVMWARIAEASGLPGHRAAMQASTSTAVFTVRDPWVNMLRTTIGCFAAATGGADIVTVRPFDQLVGVPDDLGLRVARNTQLALMEESNLHRVIDPAGGSWYVETLTDQLAEQGWRQFQQLEREGGVLESLSQGALQERIAQSWDATESAVASRRRPITGVSEFANLDEDSLQRAAYSTGESLAGADAEVEALIPHRLADGFEQLRLQAQNADPEPTVFLANIGPIPAHTARAAWAKNFFEAGGIRALANDGYDQPTALADAFSASGSSIAVICSSDTLYAEHGHEMARSLVDAGALGIYLAGDPGDLRASLSDAGVTAFVHVGCDVLGTLGAVHELLHIGEKGQP